MYINLEPDEIAQVISHVADTNGTLAGKIVGSLEWDQPEEEAPSMRATMADITEMASFMNDNKKIHAIKKARATFAIGLKEAKDLVEKTWPEVETAGRAVLTIHPLIK